LKSESLKKFEVPLQKISDKQKILKFFPLFMKKIFFKVPKINSGQKSLKNFEVPKLQLTTLVFLPAFTL
jgi:hypothetical protein